VVAVRTGRPSAVAALLAGGVAALLVSVTTVTTLMGLAAVTVLAVGLRHRSRSLVTLGALGLFGALLLSGGVSTRPGLTLAAGVGSLLCWTFAQTAVDLSGSLGTARTDRLERTHLAGTTALVAATAIVLDVLYRVDWGTLPPLAVACLLAGAVSLTIAFRP